ncbi:MAG: undecaprenyl-diphosphatase, partial [Deinococcus-Thermus bacterium]|nr:undecaprenyl-diphosphatase [Deinococcota bacterium]
ITMTAGRLIGMERAEAARFAMLLSIPTILGAGTLTGLDLAEAGDARLTGDAVLAAGLAFVAALVAIWALMRWLKVAGFGPFVVYRLVLGAGLLWWLYA